MISRTARIFACSVSVSTVLGLCFVLLNNSALGQDRKSLQYQPAPIDNPLKGLVPYQGDVRSRFPHSLEFNYVAYSSLVKGYDEFDWSPLERMLDDIASRGHQAVFRIYLEYPNKTKILPEFLIRDGLKVHKYLNTNTQPLPPSQVETPDYEDPNLRRSLQNFIAALGKKYDGDPRIGFITAGLLGTWGEWHTYPKNELFASKEVQDEVMTAYEAAFQTTPVLLRYPAGKGDHQKAANSGRKFGYHDDSFAWATLDTGKPSDSWFYMNALKTAGPDAEEKWKLCPIGGEIRPEAWGHVFDEKPAVTQVQDFRRCVEQTHVSWLMDSGMFRKKQSNERMARAESWVQRMGYEFYVSSVAINELRDSRIEVRLEIENRGVAPFYYDWRPEFGVISNGKVIGTYPSTGKLVGILPEADAHHWNDQLVLSDLPKGARYTLALRVPNPLKNGAPIRFANTSQDQDLPTWLSLGTFQLQ